MNQYANNLAMWKSLIVFEIADDIKDDVNIVTGLNMIREQLCKSLAKEASPGEFISQLIIDGHI